MKPLFLILFCLFVAFAFTQNVQAQTTVYIVRHAEKDLKAGDQSDPPLSLDGQDRAKDLAGLLRPHRVLAVYATKFKRAQQTAHPTAFGHGLAIQTYDAADPAELAAMILRQHKDGAVLIVGHSNTVPGLIEAFGIKSPMALTEEDYSYVFTLTLQGNSVHLLTSQYGKLPTKKVGVEPN